MRSNPNPNPNLVIHWDSRWHAEWWDWLRLLQLVAWPAHLGRGILGMLGLGLDLHFAHFAVLVSFLQSTFMQLLSACGVRVTIRVRYVF